MEDGTRVFIKKSTSVAMCWSAMELQAYVHCVKRQEAIGLSFQVQQEGEGPGNVTSLWLPALVLVHLKKSMCVHDQIGQRHCDSDVIIGSSLIDMYVNVEA
jgi:hypothetical protein